MAARPIWRGQIRLALVSIPIELYSGDQERRAIAFHQVHEPTGKRIKYEKVVPGVGPVDRDDIVKGYEVSKGHYVLLDPEEIESVKLESRKTLDLVQFVDDDGIDPMYFRQALLCGSGGRSGGRGLCRPPRCASKAANKIGIGQLAMRGQEYVVALKPLDRGLVLETLRYADEVNKSSGFFREIGDHKPDPDLLDMASMLIERKAGEFDPKEFHNRYVDALHRLIEEKQKKKGERIIEDPDADSPPPKGSNVIDLMAALKKSLGDEKKGSRQAEERRPRRRPPGRNRRRRPHVKGPSHGQARSARHRDLQPEARLLEDEGAQGPQAQGQGRQLRRPEARRLAAPLGFPARARRRAQELGGAQGAEPRPRREPAGDAHRGPSARLRRRSRAPSPRANMAAAR